MEEPYSRVYAEINLDNIIKNMSEKKQVITMQILIVFFIVVSVLLALDPPTFIAQLMGISADSVRRYIHRGRERIRQKVYQEEKDDE